MIGRKRLALRVFSVLSVAFVAGHAVQSIRPAQVGASLSVQASEDTNSGLPQLSGITSVAAAGSGADPDCALRLELAAAPEAMIDLSLSAPCNLGERVVIRHSGLAFTGSVGANGQLWLRFPAMSADALIAAYVGNSEIVLGKVSVEEAKDYLRMAVHLPSPVRFDLRADEGGQVFVASKSVPGKEPHRIVWLGQDKVEDPLVSQVYSVSLQEFSDPALTVELRITPDSCGRTFLADIVTSRGGRAVETHREVAVPLCGTSGDILLLKNLFPDLTLASPE